MRKAPSEGKLLYQTTSLYNIPSIIDQGIFSRKMLESTGIPFDDICSYKVSENRKHCQLGLSVYVPFHFFPRTLFEKSACNRIGYENLAIISIYRPKFSEKINQYKIIPTHPLSGGNHQLLAYKNGIQKICWDILNDYDGDNHKYDYTNNIVRCATMAECLVPQKVEPDEIAWIFVYNEKGKRYLLSKLGLNHPFTNKITINKNMFPK